MGIGSHSRRMCSSLVTCSSCPHPSRLTVLQKVLDPVCSQRSEGSLQGLHQLLLPLQEGLSPLSGGGVGHQNLQCKTASQSCCTPEGKKEAVRDTEASSCGAAHHHDGQYTFQSPWASLPSCGLHAACSCVLSLLILVFLTSKQSSLKCIHFPNMYTSGRE